MYLYPRWIRLWHLLNALFCLLLIITGLCIQYTGRVLPPDKIVRVHNIGGIILSISYLIFFIGNLVSPNRKHYRIRFKGLSGRIGNQMHYYTIGLFKGHENPFTVTREEKFNPLQKISYVIIMYLFVPLVIITGWDMMFPGFLSTILIGSMGLVVSDIIHIISGFIVSLFMVLHIYLCTLGPTPGSLFMSILSGYYTGED
jgi:thiosulfate reductase cytochrome b subunit